MCKENFYSDPPLPDYPPPSFPNGHPNCRPPYPVKQVEDAVPSVYANIMFNNKTSSELGTQELYYEFHLLIST